jgi:hypothetical protein
MSAQGNRALARGMALLAAGVPLTLLVDLADERFPAGRDDDHPVPAVPASASAAP